MITGHASLTRDDQLGIWVVAQETEIFGGRGVGDDTCRLGSKLRFMLGIDGEGENVPRIKALTVRRLEIEGGHLIFLWAFSEKVTRKYLGGDRLTCESPLLRLIDVSPPQSVYLVGVQETVGETTHN